VKHWNRGVPLWGLAIVSLVLSVTACSTTGADATRLYSMPADLGRALPPGAVEPGSPAELAEAALHLLYRERPGGPDYLGAARLCLLAAEAADPRVERDLQRACYRVAARSALRAGDRELYLEAVQRWDHSAPRHERAAGELAIHLAIRDRLSGSAPGTHGRIPAEVRSLIPSPERDL
jgi:hypothetical protein